MEKYDSALLGILQSEGKVAPFLDAILGFLFRRTDFFRVMQTDHDKLGFPPGVAKKLLVNIFTKYEMQAKKDAEKMGEMKKTNEAKNSLEKDLDIHKQSVSINSGVNEQEELVKTPYSSTQGPQIEPEDERGIDEVKNPTDSKMNEIGSNRTTAHCEKSDGSDTVKDNNDAEEKEDPEQALQRRLLQANPLTYNGAERENYFWSQTITETDLRVKIPVHIKKGKQVRVIISKKHIKVSYQMEDGSWSIVVDNPMTWEVNTEESMWTLTPGEFVHINLEKREERWWECVFVDEPKINTRKIDCSRPMTDLDDEAQAKIEEMMYNQRQKQLGLPQSHEQKTHEMLRKAWDAEGSPFKGQLFDPSKINVDANGVINMNQDG